MNGFKNRFCLPKTHVLNLHHKFIILFLIIDIIVEQKVSDSKYVNRPTIHFKRDSNVVKPMWSV